MENKNFEVPRKEISEEEIEASFENNVNSIGSDLHEAWRKTRLNPDGSYEPRMKTTKDEAWIKAHEGATQVDIANTPYSELPSDWQKESKASSIAALKAIYFNAFYGEGRYAKPYDFLTFDTIVEDESGYVHEKWLDRNREWAPPEQNQPYENLTEDEKAKDRVIVLENTEKIVKKEMVENRLKIPMKLLQEWVSKDIAALLELKEKYLQKDLGGWKVESLEFEPQEGRKVKFHIEIPQDEVSINGIFDVEPVVKFIWQIRNYVPDNDDPRARAHTKRRQEAVEELLKQLK